MYISVISGGHLQSGLVDCSSSSLIPLPITAVEQTIVLVLITIQTSD